MLSEILIEVVADGGSVSFMRPLEPESASAFWNDARRRRPRARNGSCWVPGMARSWRGTVTLLLNCPPNQPHRAEIAKLMTRPSHRGRGVGIGLDAGGRRLGRGRSGSLLVLDTAAEDGASGLYEKLGFLLAGTIPDYALKPHGGLTRNHDLLEADREEPGQGESPVPPKRNLTPSPRDETRIRRWVDLALEIPDGRLEPLLPRIRASQDRAPQRGYRRQPRVLGC